MSNTPEKPVPLRRLKSGLKLGAAVAMAVSAAIAAAGKIETGDAWGPFNDVSHIVLGEDHAPTDGFHPLITPLGFALHVGSMEMWGVLYRLAWGKPRLPVSLLTSSGASILVYLFDYYLAPKRLAPGFEGRLSRQAVYFIYVVLALAFLVGDQDGQ
jgi:hypothetical protein